MKLLEQINKFVPYFKKLSDVNAFRNILVVSNTGLGDTLLSTPSIVSLRKSFPEIRITFLINKKMFPLFEGFEFIDDFVLYSSGFLSQLKIINELLDQCINLIPPGDVLYVDLMVIKKRVDEFIKVYDEFKDNPYKTGSSD